ncbi:hypothetical protein BOTBODRAFT_26331 [Botryobasidium botryosum FD-172 SS1]|uniref:Endoribonuclease YSH1 n=1 Tax=Botryobasidium botryosum (strain FD-172 SS1) TaxID=930990 RepID=A0A067NCT7_BOTB1|nr:hypothetical protein BOTBODRAFT_26331 [Botryobasidium botryosum FD-172 SS1]
MPSAATDSPILSITLLGAGQEVGRSCCVLQYRGKTVVCDAGVHPAHSGMASLPFVDELDWSTVDALLITHFHLDHAASLTYIMEKTNFKDGKGKVYMTHPTKAVFKFMMQDFVRTSTSSNEPLFTPLELSLSLPNIIPISTHQQITPCPGLSFTPYHAGHVLGACMFMIDIAGLKILYTGDYSREEDRHLVKAEVPPVRPDVLIVESTYGVQSLEGRVDKEARLTSLIHSIIKRGGHALLPVFALGRAQELLLVLDEYWAKHPELHNVPIYFSSSLARKCMNVYQTYIHTMNSNIRDRFARRDNPFVFKHISHLPQSRNWERKISDGPPCVVLASPAFLHNGTSRELLELWAPDPRNGLIITGYSVEGTLARDIVNEPDEIPNSKGGAPIPLRCSVDYISFSAHVDYTQNSEFIEMVKAQHVVLVHGEQTAMGRLRAALQSKYKDMDEDVKIHTPRNLEVLELSFRSERVGKAIGTLAARPPKVGDLISGLLVSKDYSYTLLDPRDLRDFTGLTTSTVIQKMKVEMGVGWDLVRWHLEGMYGSVEEGRDDTGIKTMRVMGAVDVKHTAEHELTLEWVSSASNDMLADSALGIIMGIDKSPASVKMTTHKHAHAHPHAEPSHPHSHSEELDNALRVERIAMFLEAHFGDLDLIEGKESEDIAPAILLRLDEWEARVSLDDMVVHCTHEPLRKRVEAVLEMAISTVGSLAGSYVSGDADVGMILDDGDKGAKSGVVEDVPMDVVKQEQPDGLAQKQEQEEGGDEGDEHGAESDEEGSEEEDDDSMLQVIG